jgi:hypothetical protein
VRTAAALVSCVILAVGCASPLVPIAERRAAGELSCRPPALRVQPTGELAVGADAQPLRVELFDAEGCEREQRYLCVDVPQPRCVTHVAELALPPRQRAALERALHLLRTTARARCPGSDLAVIQESETLFRFHACDGAWLYHCRAHRCERL